MVKCCREGAPFPSNTKIAGVLTSLTTLNKFHGAGADSIGNEILSGSKICNMVNCQKIRMISHKTWTNASCTVEIRSFLKRLGKFEDANSFKFCKLQLEWFSCLQKREFTSMRLARWTANHPRSRVFHFKLVLFNDSKKIPQAKTQSKANWTKRPLLYNETMADSTTLQMPCVLNHNKKGKRIPSPNNRRSLQYAGIPSDTSRIGLKRRTSNGGSPSTVPCGLNEFDSTPIWRRQKGCSRSQLKWSSTREILSTVCYI